MIKTLVQDFPARINLLTFSRWLSEASLWSVCMSWNKTKFLIRGICPGGVNFARRYSSHGWLEVDAYLMAARNSSMTLRKGFVVKNSNPLGVGCQLGPPSSCQWLLLLFLQKGHLCSAASLDEVSAVIASLVFLTCRQEMPGELVGWGSALLSSVI